MNQKLVWGKRVDTFYVEEMKIRKSFRFHEHLFTQFREISIKLCKLVQQQNYKMINFTRLSLIKTVISSETIVTLLN